MQPTPAASSQPQIPPNPTNPKLDADILNASYLETEGYLENGSVRVIVKLTNSSEQLLGSISSLDGNLLGTFSDLSMAVVEVPYLSIDNFADSPSITNIYLDKKIECLDSNSLPIIQPPEEWATITGQYGSLTGVGLKIAILDTGIDPDHPDFYFADGTSKIIADADFSYSNHTYDGYGHGTHCASIAAGTGLARQDQLYKGVAPDAFLINAKIMSDSGKGYDSWAIEGIQWAVNDAGADVLSMSFGTSTPYTDGSDPLCQAVDWATSKGVVCSVAAGNKGGCYSTINTPACAKTAIAVGSCNNSRYVTGSSSRGPTSDYRIKPDIIAPGVNIIAARASGTSRGKLVGEYYTTLSGTSMAAPHVAGAAALIKQAHPSWTPQQIKLALVESAKPTLDLFDDPLAVGGGIVDVANAITVSTFASNESVSFYVDQTPTAKTVNSTLTFTSSASTSNFAVGKCASSLPFPLTYSDGSVFFLCPANTTAEWSGRLKVAGGSQFSNVSIPALAVTEYTPPSVDTWTTVKTVSTPENWPRAFAVAADRLYVADSYYSGLILEYKLPDMTLLRSLTLPETMINSIVVSDGYLYAGTTYGFIFQVPLSSFTVQARTEMPKNAGITKLLVCNSKLYATSWNGTLCKFDPLNLAIMDSFRLDDTIRDGVVGNCNLYFITLKGNLWWVNPETLDTAKVNLGENGFGLNSLVAANGNLYAVANNYPGNIPYVFGFFPQLFKISYDLKVLDHVSLKLPQFSSSLTLAYDDNELYVLSHYNPSSVSQINTLLRVDLDTLTPDATWSYHLSVPHTSGIWSDQPFLAGVESAAAWNNYFIVGYDSGKLVLSKDNSPTTYAPTCVSFDVNSTRAGQPSQISVWWHSKAGLSGFIAGSNVNGVWVNQPWQPLSGNFAAANYTLTPNRAAGTTVVWKVWCNDTNNHWSETDYEAFTLTTSQYYNLAILPSEASGTNPAVGEYSYPAGKVVTIGVNEATTKDYRFQYWLVDGLGQPNNPITVVMDGDHELKPVHRLTGEIVEWERFSPIHVSATLSLYCTYDYAGSPYHAETFTVGDTPHTVTSVKIYMSVMGRPSGPVTVSIRATANGVPFGPDLASGTVDLASFPSAQPSHTAFRGWVTVPMTSPSNPRVLSPNTQYALVISTPNDDSSNCVGWGNQFLITQYSGGNFFRLQSDGVTWQLVGDADELFVGMNGVFEIWGTTTNPNAPTPTPTPTPTPSYSTSTSSTSSSSSAAKPAASPKPTPTPPPTIITPTPSTAPSTMPSEIAGSVIAQESLLVVIVVIIAVLAAAGALVKLRRAKKSNLN